MNTSHPVPPRMPEALVLSAGLGMRLRPLSWLRAKPAMPVAGAPLIAHILRWLASHGVSDAIVNLHHRPETVAAAVGDGSAYGLRVRYSWEQPLLGSGGGPARAFTLAAGDELLVVNGDTLTDIDARALYAAHAGSGALVTLGLITNPQPGRYGGVQLGTDGAVERFTPRGYDPPGWHFVGVQVVRRPAYEGVSPDEPSESVAELYPRLLAAHPRSVRGWTTDARFDDVGTPASYLETCLQLSRSDPAKLIDERADVAPGARLRDTICWPFARVEDDVVLDACIVCSGATVRSGSRYHRAVLLPADAAPPGPHDHVDGAIAVSPIDR